MGKYQSLIWELLKSIPVVLQIQHRNFVNVQLECKGGQYIHYLVPTRQINHRELMRHFVMSTKQMIYKAILTMTHHSQISVEFAAHVRPHQVYNLHIQQHNTVEAIVHDIQIIVTIAQLTSQHESDVVWTGARSVNTVNNNTVQVSSAAPPADGLIPVQGTSLQSNVVIVRGYCSVHLFDTSLH